MKKALRLFYRINPLTIYFNLRYFPVKVALKLPVLLFGRVSIHALKGNIILEGPIKTGMIRIGDLKVGIFDKRMASVLNIYGTIKFKGKASLGKGTSISVGEGAYLEFGERFTITAKSSIVSSGKQRVIIGNDCLVSWDVLIMNTDFHQVIDMESDTRLNEAKDVIINDNVWIGCRCNILKGTKISKNVVIAADAIVSGELSESNSIYAGVIAKKIKGDIKWKV